MSGLEHLKLESQKWKFEILIFSEPLFGPSGLPKRLQSEPDPGEANLLYPKNQRSSREVPKVQKEEWKIDGKTGRKFNPSLIQVSYKPFNWLQEISHEFDKVFLWPLDLEPKIWSEIVHPRTKVILAHRFCSKLPVLIHIFFLDHVLIFYHIAAKKSSKKNFKIVSDPGLQSTYNAHYISLNIVLLLST